MEHDYIYVINRHRVFNPQSADYMNLSKYLRMMCDLHGLDHDPIAPFTIPSGYSCYRVVDKGKAILFCINNGDQIIKPEKTTNDFLNFQ